MNFYNELVADGRAHRLSKCAPLSSALSSCMSQRESALKALHLSTSSSRSSPPPSPGLSGWLFGSSPSSAPAPGVTATDAPPPPPLEAFAAVPTCFKEENLMWHCRAMAYGCGSEILSLKRCSEGSGKEADKDCKAEQKGLLLCVRKGRESHELFLQQQQQQQRQTDAVKQGN